MSTRPLVPAVLLIAAGVLTIISTFLPVAQTTDRLLDSGTFADHSKVDVTTYTAWSIDSTVPSPHPVLLLDGWALVLAGAVAVLAAVLLLAARGSWRKPLAAMASGLVFGVILMCVLTFTVTMSGDYVINTESHSTTAGPAVWFQIPAGVLALVVAILTLAASGRPTPSAPVPPPYGWPPHQPPFPPSQAAG